MLSGKEKISVTRLEEGVKILKWKFVLVYGISFGLIMIVFSCIFDMVFDHVSFSQLFRKNFWTYLGTAPIAGLFFGLILRWTYTRQYKKLKAKQESPSL